MEKDIKLIDPSRVLTASWQRKLYSMFGDSIERILDFDSFNRYYNAIERKTEGGENFFEAALQVLGINYVMSDADREKIACEGPVVVVCNHPFGGIDGIILGAILSSVRKDVKILVNYLLNEMEGIRPWIIPVDPFGGDSATRKNLQPIKETLKWLKAGGVVGTFPSGTVSHYHLHFGRVTDPKWSPNTAALIRRSNASVIPIYFSGRNSLLFHLFGLIHPRFRTALLPRELCRQTRSTVEVRVGAIVRPGKWGKIESDSELVEYLRLKTYILKNRSMEGGSTVTLSNGRKAEALTEPIPREEQEKEVTSLPEDSLLVKHGAYSVYCAKAEQIPSVLQEIGRLREFTFREVGEGTGKRIDLDEFDDYYEHLFMWSHEEREIVGAYRMGRTDEILEKFGCDGLYTSTLFHFKKGILDHLRKGLEMGRSFIVPKYQRKHASLAMIWRGIGEYVIRNPQYKILYGPVSISQDYQKVSRDLMVSFLKSSKVDPELASWVRAKNPPKKEKVDRQYRRELGNTVRSIDDISALVSEIELDNKGIPLLLRYYLNLNAKLLSFNVDEEFSHCIDGLISVDLTETDRRLLARFMGKTKMETYLAKWE